VTNHGAGISQAEIEKLLAIGTGEMSALRVVYEERVPACQRTIQFIGTPSNRLPLAR
jgi:hypothetical protein